MNQNSTCKQHNVALAFNSPLARNAAHGWRIFDKPIQAVDRALSIDPDNARALVLKSVLLLQRSTTLFYNAKPARPSLDEAIALARRAVSQALERSYSYDQLAQSLEFKVLFAGDMDEVVRETCSEALRAVERSLSLAEASPESRFLERHSTCE